MENKGYRVKYRIKGSQQTGISYGPVLQNIKSMMGFRIPDFGLIEFVVDYGVDGDWTTIESVGYHRSASDVPSLGFGVKKIK